MIEISSFTKRFDSLVALNHISFTINKGSIFGLVGSNGAGKSTLLRSLCGIYAPDDGAIYIDGAVPYENPILKTRVVFVPDFPYYLPQASLRTMADLYRRVYPNWSNTEYLRLCALFGLNQKAKLHNMSKGMQRQAALICALSTMPDYLLLDEVFDGLDPVMRQLLKRIISEQVSERNMTVVIASHNLRELEDFCDHVGLIHQGGILFEQELDTLKLGIHKAQAVFQPPLEQQQIQWLKEQLDIIKLETHGSMVSLVARRNQETVEQTLAELHPVFSETLPLSLEEVFISEMEAAGYDLNKILS